MKDTKYRQGGLPKLIIAPNIDFNSSTHFGYSRYCVKIKPKTVVSHWKYYRGRATKFYYGYDNAAKAAKQIYKNLKGKYHVEVSPIVSSKIERDFYDYISDSVLAWFDSLDMAK